jgi:hypothetical protein
MPPVDKGVLRDFRNFVRKWLRRYLHVLSPEDLHQTLREALADSHYNEKRKQQLEESLLQSREDNMIHSGFKSHKALKCFIKTEAYTKFNFPRWIMSRSDNFKVRYYILAKAMERAVYDVRDADGEVLFIKHVPVTERASLISRILGGDKVGETDFTGFEALSPEVMKNCECQLYSYLCSAVAPAEIQDFNRTLVGEQSMYCQSVKAQIKGRRMSGELVTSLGNGFTNLMVLLYVAERSGTMIRPFVEGDDGIFAIRGNSLDVGLFEKLGFQIKFQEASSFGELSFCGITCDEVVQQAISDPVTLLTVGWSHSRQMRGGRGKILGLLRAKALSLLAEAPGCPILNVLANRLIHLTNGVKPVLPQTYWWNEVMRGIELETIRFEVPAPQTRCLFSRRYGLSVVEQLELEEYFSGIRVDTVLDHPLLDKLFEENEALCFGSSQVSRIGRY